MNLPDIMRLDSKAIDQAIEEALAVLEASNDSETLESDRHAAIQFGLSERFISFVAGSSMTMRDRKVSELAAEQRMTRVMMLCFLSGWLAHARLEQPKWAENLNGKVN